MVALAVVLVGLAGPAGAHVSGRATAVTPDGSTTVQFAYDHGCGTSPTIGLRVKLPADTTAVNPGDAPTGWVGAVEGDVLSWSGPPVPDGRAARYTATMRLVGNEGDQVALPTIQQCAQGTNDWIELPQPGQPEPEYVAPTVTLLATVAAPPTTPAPPAPTSVPAPTGGTGTAAPTVPGTGAIAASTGVVDDGGLPVGLLVGVGVAVVVVGGGIAVLRGRRADHGA